MTNRLHRRTIQGEPIRVGKREIVPEARVTGWIRRQGVMTLQGSAGWGAGFVHVRPTALIERGPEGERRIPVTDVTGRMLAGLAAGGIFVMFLMHVAERLATRREDQDVE